MLENTYFTRRNKKYDLSYKWMCNNINMCTFVRLSNIKVDYIISYLFYFFKHLLHKNCYYIFLTVDLNPWKKMSHKTNKSLGNCITYLFPRLWLSVKWLLIKGSLSLLHIFSRCIIDRHRNMLWVVLVNWSHCFAVIQLIYVGTFFLFYLEFRKYDYVMLKMFYMPRQKIGFVFQVDVQ